MKKLELLLMLIAVALTIMFFMYIGFITGRDYGNKEKGEWIKIVDTTVHYEFKSLK